MKKVIRPGTIKVNGHFVSVYCEINFDGKKLSICGVEGPTGAGNCAGGCGQINPIDIHNFAKGWNSTKLNLLNSIWERYHLNDLKAGCIHQRLLGWEKEGYKIHPSESCPVCGYKFGTKWLKEEVPGWVIKLLEELPESDKTPAWV